MDLMSAVVKFNYNGAPCEVRIPTARRLASFSKELESAGDDVVKVTDTMIGFLVEQGLDEKIADQLSTSHVKQLFEALKQGN